MSSSVSSAGSLCAQLRLIHCMDCQELADGEKKGKVHRAMFEALESRIRRMISGCCPTSVSFESIREDIKAKRISYTGEEISQPISLTVEQIEKGLPPVGHGGSVPMLPFLKGRTRFLVENPLESLLPAGERLTAPAKAKVRIKRGEELNVFKCLERRGVIEWISAKTVFNDGGTDFLNGMFGVEKPHKFTSSGLPVLRVIMNLVPVNALFRVIAGDITSLPAATLWLPLALSDGMSQGDMSSAFYLFDMPPCWRPSMCFNYAAPGHLVGKDTADLFRPSCKVLPMGWNFSVGLMQAILREVLLSHGIPAGLELRKSASLPTWFTQSVASCDQKTAWWQVYLDNFMSAEKGPETSQVNQQLQEMAMQAWKHVGILTAEDKQVLNSKEVTELGVRFDGTTGLLGGSPERIHRACLAALHLLIKGNWCVKDAQVVLGRFHPPIPETCNERLIPRMGRYQGELVRAPHQS